MIDIQPHIDKPTFKEWIKEQKGVKWPHGMAGLMVYLYYNDVMCAGLITKINGSNDYISIRPMRPSDDIGSGKGASVSMYFKHE
jgi:hypothetical protein